MSTRDALSLTKAMNNLKGHVRLNFNFKNYATTFELQSSIIWPMEHHPSLFNTINLHVP